MVELSTLSPLKGDAPQSLATAMPNLMRALQTYDEGAPATLRFGALGSSVWVGATLPDPTTQNPGRVLYDQLLTVINRLGNITTTFTNGAENGSVANDGALTDYAALKAAAGGPLTVLFLGYGMNDGMTTAYHRDQTLPGYYRGRGKNKSSAMRTILEMAVGDGTDVILTTSPFPHSTRTPWTNAVSPINFPSGGVAIPALTLGGSVQTSDWLNMGSSVPASYRHMRINEATRQAAADFGLPLLDAERYWMRALAIYGEDALFNVGEYAHPNLLGHQQSYGLASADFVNGLRRPTLACSPPTRDPEIVRTKILNSTRTTTTLSDDSELSFYAGANTEWDVTVDVRFTAPTAGGLKFALNLPSGAAGKLDVIGPAYDSTTFDSQPGIHRSTTVSGNLRVGGIGADGFARVTAKVRTGSTGGNVTVQWAQHTASGTTTIYADTTMTAVKRIT